MAKNKPGAFGAGVILQGQPQAQHGAINSALSFRVGPPVEHIGSAHSLAANPEIHRRISHHTDQLSRLFVFNHQ